MSYNKNMIKINMQKLKEEYIDSLMEIESVAFGKYHWSENSFKNELTNKMLML